MVEASSTKVDLSGTFYCLTKWPFELKMASSFFICKHHFLNFSGVRPVYFLKNLVK